MKIYKIDASDLFLQDDSGGGNICGVLFLSTKRKALTTARAIAKEARQFKVICDKWRKKISDDMSAEDVAEIYKTHPTHDWAAGNSGTVSVSLLTAKTLPIRILAETMLNRGEWVEESSAVWERSV